MKKGMTLLAWFVLTAVCAAGGWRPTLAELVQRETVVRGLVDPAALAVEARGCIVPGGLAEILIEEVLVGEVARGATLRVGSGDARTSGGDDLLEVFAFISEDDVVFRRVPNDEARRSLRRGIDSFRALGPSVDTMPVDELKTIFLDMVRDPYLRFDALEQMRARRVGLAPRVGGLAPTLENRVPRMRLSSSDKALLVDVVESLENVDNLDRLVVLIGGFGGARYGLALYRLVVAHPDVVPGTVWTRLAEITKSEKVARDMSGVSVAERLEVLRPYGESWARTARLRAR